MRARRLILAAAALGVAAYVSMPPRPRPPAASPGIAAPVRGAVHIHTRRSDGSGTVEQVARAASRAGLGFVILTDHGDGTRVPDEPVYHDGVLVIDAVEISTDQGHVVALDLPKAPYPLAGEARDVVEDVTRTGGFAIAAHPDSRKSELRWSDWRVPIDGLEYFNEDSEWRDEPVWRLTRALLTYPFRRAETLASLFDRSEALQRWDALTKARRVAGIAAVDAHGRIGLFRAEEPYRDGLALPVPGYEPVFRTVSVALPGARLSSNAAADARLVVDEIRGGRLFSSIDALSPQPAFEYTATSGAFRASGGDVLPLSGPVRFSVKLQAPADAQIVLLRDGASFHTARGSSLQYDAEPGASVYRVEVNLPEAPGHPPIPWIVSNPIYVGWSGAAAPVSPQAAVTSRTDLYVDGAAPEWTIEHSASSQAAVDVVKAVTGTQLLLRYALSGSASSHPFAAVVRPVDSAIAGHDRLTFEARADRPMRVSVQLRAPEPAPDGERWHRSVFVDATSREISIPFNEMRPRGSTDTPTPTLDRIRSLLFVVDTVNTPVGTAGQLWLDSIRFERSEAGTPLPRQK